MVKFEECVVIDRPVEEVFAFLGGLENDPAWTSAAELRPRTSTGPIGIDTTFRQRARLLGRRLEFSFEVVGYEADHSITLKATSASAGRQGGSVTLISFTPWSVRRVAAAGIHLP